MTINVGPAIQQLTAFADAGKKQVTFATRVALTRTAQLASANLKHEMRDIFRSPTPYTLSSLFVRPATKTNLTAEVKLKDFAAKLLALKALDVSALHDEEDESANDPVLPLPRLL